MLDQVKLKDIYSRYGFEITKSTDGMVLVFLYKRSRYFGADIVPIGENVSKENIEHAKEAYSKLGYATQVKTYKKVEDAEEELFKSFFSFDSSIKRLERKYSDFTARLSETLGSKYQYVSSPFDFEGIEEKQDNILDTVNRLIAKDSPHLLIIEAAAGFGKTCTAYEILNSLTHQGTKSPLFTELSRNRSAKIFRYILLDEIDIEYPTLNSELVNFEIESGRIPLIIDGFDELLTKQSTTVIKDINEQDIIEEVESMLDTIGKLLKGKAKVILTTRKTAIFSSGTFSEWISRWGSQFGVSRILIKEPMVKDWLGDTRHGLIRHNNIPIQSIANPVLLAYLKNLDNDEFGVYLSDPGLLVNKYFVSLLDRERERQNLPITVDVQYRIFQSLAKMMFEFDVSSESKDFIKEIIIDANKSELENAKKLYTSLDRQTLEQLADTLASHALLDRKSEDNFIGFVNDFVFGNFIAEVICEEPIEFIEKNFSGYMIELAITAYKVQSSKRRKELWEKIQYIQDKLPKEILFIADIYLMNEILHNYSESIFNSFTIYEVEFSDKFNFKSCVFINCTFKSCHFSPNAFDGTSFLECEFNKCVNGENYDLSEDHNVYILKPIIKDCSLLKSYSPKIILETNQLLEKEILKKIMSVRNINIIQLAKKMEGIDTKVLYSYLNSFIERKFISLNGKNIIIEINRITEIKDIINN